jgi:2-C-methyl-D-erythritol 2,4-cyclodiphosphate synthase
MRIGFGSDIHRLAANLPLRLGGVFIESDLGAVGHSDADALLHAVTDAILGALALGDIGSHFPDQDSRWHNADSRIFLAESVKIMREKNLRVVNLDSTISLEKPKLRPYILAMRENLAQILGIDLENVSVKAKTGEAVDAVGTRRAVRAEAVVLLEKQNVDDRFKSL